LLKELFGASDRTGNADEHDFRKSEKRKNLGDAFLRGVRNREL
jgi:hypothetical protein